MLFTNARYQETLNDIVGTYIFIYSPEGGRGLLSDNFIQSLLIPSIAISSYVNVINSKPIGGYLSKFRLCIITYAFAAVSLMKSFYSYRHIEPINHDECITA